MFRPSGVLAVALVLASVGALVGIAVAQTFGPGWLYFARQQRGAMLAGVADSAPGQTPEEIFGRLAGERR